MTRVERTTASTHRFPGVARSSASGDLLELLPHTEGDLRAISRDGTGSVGSDRHGFIVSEGRGGQDPGIRQMAGERLKGDACGKARTAPQCLDKGGDVAFVGHRWNLEQRRLRGAVPAIRARSQSPN